MPESDWKAFRELQRIALQRFCERTLEEVRTIVDEGSQTPHERYLRLYRLLKERDDQLAHAFNGARRSRMLWQLAAIHHYGLLGPAELARFSEATRDTVQWLASTQGSLRGWYRLNGRRPWWARGQRRYSECPDKQELVMDLGEAIVKSVWVLIPLCALAIPLVAVIGGVIVRPISLALTRLAESERASLNSPTAEARFRELDDRLARMERQLDRVLSERESQRQLESGYHTGALGTISPAGADRPLIRS